MSDKIMKIEPCRKEIHDLILVWGVLYLAGLLFLLFCLIFKATEKLDFFTYFMLFALLTISTIGSCIDYSLYLGRTFILDENGCTVILGKYQRTYEWAELYVQYCEMPPWKSDRFAEFPGSGILISRKPIIKSPPETPMCYCVEKHSTFCVFFRFTLKDTNQEDARPKCGKEISFTGYMVEKEPLLKLVSHADVVKRFYD